MNEQTLSRVVDCISETTRYPTKLLRVDADIESDLGIDSVKRVEIIIALGEEFGIDLASQSADPSIRTIGDLAHWVHSLLPQGESEPTKGRATKVRATKVRATKVRATKVRATKARTTKARTTKVRTIPACSTTIRASGTTSGDTAIRAGVDSRSCDCPAIRFRTPLPSAARESATGKLSEAPRWAHRLRDRLRPRHWSDNGACAGCAWRNGHH